MSVSPRANLSKKCCPVAPATLPVRCPGSAGQRSAADGAHANAESGESRLPRASKPNSLQAAGGEPPRQAASAADASGTGDQRGTDCLCRTRKGVLDWERDSSWSRKVRCNLLPPRTSPTFVECNNWPFLQAFRSNVMASISLHTVTPVSPRSSLPLLCRACLHTALPASTRPCPPPNGLTCLHTVSPTTKLSRLSLHGLACLSAVSPAFGLACLHTVSLASSCLACLYTVSPGFTRSRLPLHCLACPHNLLLKIIIYCVTDHWQPSIT